MTQQQINAAFRRSLKTTYVGLSNLEYRLIKKQERYDSLSKSIGRTYQSGKFKYGDDFRKDERFFDDFDRIFEWEEEKERILISIRRMEEKHDIDREDVFKKHNLAQRGRGYGGSY